MRPFVCISARSRRRVALASLVRLHASLRVLIGHLGGVPCGTDHYSRVGPTLLDVVTYETLYTGACGVSAPLRGTYVFVCVRPFRISPPPLSLLFFPRVYVFLMYPPPSPPQACGNRVTKHVEDNQGKLRFKVTMVISRHCRSTWRIETTAKQGNTF